MKFESKLWASDYSLIPSIYSGDREPIVSSAEMKDCGWIQVGTCTVECNLIKPEDTIQSEIESLKLNISKIQAEAERTITQLRSRISDLLAITHDGGGV